MSLRPSSAALALVLAAPVAAAQDWTVVPVGTTGDLHAFQPGGSGFLGYVVGDGGFVAQSDAAGTVWTPISVNTSAGLHGLLQPASGQVWVSGAGGVVRLQGPPGTWNARDVPDADETYVLTTQSSGEAIALGSGGSIWKTVSFGQAWTFIQNAGVALHDGVGGTAAFGLAVGDGGTILKTTDSGASWTPRPSGTTADLYGVVGAGTGSYFAVGEGGTILYSGDGGETWSPRESGTTATLRDVESWGDARIVAVGDGGTMVRSSFTGEQWCRLSPGVTADLHAVHAEGLAFIAAVGEGGLMIRTDNGGGDCVNVATEPLPAAGYALSPARPNPAREAATLRLEVARAQDVVAEAFDVAGRRVAVLHDGPLAAAVVLTLDGRRLAPGAYVVRVRGEAFEAARRVVVVR